MATVSYAELLRETRASRGFSQQRLAQDAGVSTRHLSFLENGRALPSREMIAQICDALDVAPRQRNAMLLAAGFAPIYRESALESPELAWMRQVLGKLIESHAPYPALVLDRGYDIVMASASAQRLAELTSGGRPPPTNLLRWLLSSDGLRPYVTNWHEVASQIVRRLRREARSPAERASLERLVRESLGGTELEASGSHAPVVAVHWRFGDLEIATVSTITTFGTSADVTLDELHVETVLPADERSDAVLCALLARSKA